MTNEPVDEFTEDEKEVYALAEENGIEVVVAQSDNNKSNRIYCALMRVNPKRPRAAKDETFKVPSLAALGHF